jgi:hypothetical protein
VTEWPIWQWDYWRDLFGMVLIAAAWLFGRHLRRQERRDRRDRDMKR